MNISGRYAWAGTLALISSVGFIIWGTMAPLPFEAMAFGSIWCILVAIYFRIGVNK